MVVELREALSDIADIRAHLDRDLSYRGFRSVAIGISAILVIAGSWRQLQLGEDVTFAPARYLDIWLVVALASLAVMVTEMIIRGRISNDLSVWKMHGKVIGSLLPSFVVGALITATLVFETGSYSSLSRDSIWMLPGIWALIYSLGLFASSHWLHRATRIAAVYYLLAGSIYLFFNGSLHRTEAWHMVAIFGCGQLLLAGILYWKVERKDG